MRIKVLFVGAKTFSGTGGIEQVNKSWMYSLSQQNNIVLKSLVLTDTEADLAYTGQSFFKGYGGHKIKFLWDQLRYALQADMLIISHIQLAVLIPLLKLIKPRLKTLVICHGIEVWKKLNPLQLIALQQTCQILAVSSFTKKKLMDLHGIKEKQIEVFPNALDPFFKVPSLFEASASLIKRYQIKPNEVVLLTIARLSSAEQYKGYDFVISSLKYLKETYPQLKYIIGGKADTDELKRLQNLIKANGVEGQVILPGFIAEEEMVAHYQLANVFVMPSTGEGFGISFIESAACGTPVLGGNSDGSSEAIITGVTGELCPPKNPTDIAQYLDVILKSKMNKQLIQENALKNYSFEVYHQGIINLLTQLYKNI
nr:glycosyltransferase family 4 protein [uncultured Pedobacter sp.]